MRPIKHRWLFFLLFGLPVGLYAQPGKRDTTGSVDIISPFKPALRDLIKVQFAATPPAVDTQRTRLAYRIPNQELSIVYQPGTLKPLAYQADSNTGFQSSSFIKLGYGSLRNPFVSGALTFGTKSPVRIYGGHQSATGTLPYQAHSITNGMVTWQLPDRTKGEWMSALAFDRQRFNKYGFDKSLPTPPTDSIRQVFHQIALQLGYRRIEPTATGFYVEPQVDIKFTTDALGNQDLNARLFIPVRYRFNERFALRVEGLAHGGRIKPVNGPGRDQSVYSLNPSLHFTDAAWSIQAGIRPSWDAVGTRLYPDVLFFWNRSTKPWSIRLQWTGELQRVGYRELYTQNPWLWMPAQWRNQGSIDRSLRWQYNRRAHWVYELQTGYQTLHDAFLFTNDTTAAGDGKSFQVVYADRIQNLYLLGKVSYRQSDRWLMRAELRWNNYHGLRGVDRPWGLLPFEWNFHGWHRFANRWKVQADLSSWFAPYFLQKDGQPGRTQGALDLNLGAQVPISRSISGWLQFNNLLNQSYRRWSPYPTYGFHFVGGVVFSLDKSLF